MEQVVLVIHLILALAIIGLVLLQRSEGGGLGIGGSGGLGGLATPGGTANVLSRMTAICAMCFFGTSLILGILAGTHGNARSLLDQIGTDLPAAAATEGDNQVEEGATPAEVPVEPEEAPSVPVE